MNDSKTTRRDFLKTGAAMGMALTLGATAGRSGEDNMSKRPNLLLVFSDQQHWQAMGCMNEFFDTPHQDALAKEAVLFERSFCATPQCSPSRSTLLTGLYPSKTGVMGNVGNAGGNPLKMATLGKELQEAGYCTGYFGKWHLGNEEVATAGWDHKDFSTDDPKAEKNAIEFLTRTRDKTKPFALFVSIHNPHDIYHFKKHQPEGPLDNVPLPESWQEETFENKPPIQKQFMSEDQGKAIVGKPREDWQHYRDCYRAKNQLYDENLGRILNALKAQSAWDETLLIHTSDHGDMDAHHRLIFKGPFLYEHMMRVPLIIRLPKVFGGVGGRRVKEIDVVNTDIAPTIRELCTLPAQPSQGQSLAPILRGATKYKAREFVVGEYYSKQRWVNPIRMIRTHEWKFNRHIRWGDELYHLKDDPHELTNLANDPAHAAIRDQLAAKLEGWIEQQEDPFHSLAPTDRRGRPLA